MRYADFENNIRELITLNENQSPMFSCYLDLTDPNWKNYFKARANIIKKSLSESQKVDHVRSFKTISRYLENELKADSQGVAIFCRETHDPYFKAMQFKVPVPNWVMMGSLPNIYHLVELKDSYHRYIIVISNLESVRILEVNLGQVTESLWTKMPELRNRVGKSWTKFHYQNHREHRSKKFIKEKIAVLNRLMQAGDHSHLIITGNPKTANYFSTQLPKNLQEKLIDTLHYSEQKASAVVAKTLESFIEQEKVESFNAVLQLQETLKRGGLAVAGPEQSLKALENGQVDLLVISQELEDISLREELTRLATLSGCQIETVSKNPFLDELDGVGCFIRYLLPEQIDENRLCA